MTIAILKNICYTPYYRKLTLHEINPDFKNSRLIMSFIFVYVNFRDLNFSCFGPGQIFPSYVYGKSHEQSVHSILDYTLNFVPVCVSTSFDLCERPVNFLYFEISPSQRVSLSR